jgi:uncharacterized protein YjcR
MAGTHARNFGPMLVSPRCGAKTRTGTNCLAPAAKGKERCRMHGGAKGSGAPRGNQNALKNGFYTKSSLEELRALKDLMRRSKDFLEEFEW